MKDRFKKINGGLRAVLFGVVALSLWGLNGEVPTAYSQDANKKAGSNKAAINYGVVGDVKYSLLAPTDFIRLHGPQWALLAGQELPPASTLRKLTNLKSVPDARGVFLRGMNKGRDMTEGDAAGDREVGSYQSDAIVLTPDHHVNAVKGEGNTSAVLHFRKRDAKGRKDSKLETRPRNVAIYIYVRIL